MRTLATLLLLGLSSSRLWASATCSIEVDGLLYHHGECRYSEELGSDRYWRVEVGQKTDDDSLGYWALLLEQEDGTFDGHWNGSYGADRAHNHLGSLHAHDDFWQWWSKDAHSELFCEPTARQIRVLDENSGFEPTLSNDTLTLELPLEVRSSYLIARIRTVLKQYEARAKAAKAISRARYPVVTKPVLTSLHQHLTVYDAYDAYRANPKLKLYELYDLIHAEAGLYVRERVDGETVDDLRKLDLPYNDVLRTVRQRKANLVRRHIRIAEQYIAGVGEGQFPKRDGR